jgi:hypothetical protein
MVQIAILQKLLFHLHIKKDSQLLTPNDQSKSFGFLFAAATHFLKRLFYALSNNKSLVTKGDKPSANIDF